MLCGNNLCCNLKNFFNQLSFCVILYLYSMNKFLLPIGLIEINFVMSFLNLALTRVKLVELKEVSV